MQTSTLMNNAQDGPVAKKAERRPHIYELDPLRALTALIVIAVHVIFFTKFMSLSQFFQVTHYGLLIVTHFTRSVFMFVTSFALVYVYYGKPFSWGRFWSKRSIGVILPYCVWTCIYVWYNWHPEFPRQYVIESLESILNGQASYQLYYIQLTLQIYFLLPFFLYFLGKVKHHPWIVLSISFVIEMLTIYIDYHYFQVGGTVTLTGFWAGFFQYQDSYFFLYQFWIILGGMAALYQQQVRDFVARHGVAIVVLMLAALVALLGHYYLEMFVVKAPILRVTTTLEPVNAVYMTAIIIFEGWLAVLWARRKGADGKPRGYKFWQFMGEASFGVYLIHAFFISYAMNVLVPKMPSSWSGEFRSFLVWLFVIVCSYGCSIILMKTPILSRLVGRHQPWPKWLLAGSQRANSSKA
jgi:probable poly-beta-1,6-N-acetyl-D-glucosamine export protein